MLLMVDTRLSFLTLVQITLRACFVVLFESFRPLLCDEESLAFLFLRVVVCIVGLCRRAVLRLSGFLCLCWELVLDVELPLAGFLSLRYRLGLRGLLPLPRVLSLCCQ